MSVGLSWNVTTLWPESTILCSGLPLLLLPSCFPSLPTPPRSFSSSCYGSTSLSPALWVPLQRLFCYEGRWLPQCMSDPSPFPPPYLVFDRMFLCSLSEFLVLNFSGHFMPQSCLRQLLRNVWILWIILIIICQVSQPYSNTTSMLDAKSQSFVCILILLALQTSFNIMNAALVFTILDATSLSVPPSLLMMLSK